MGRTRLRGIERAGLRIAIEVPASLAWRGHGTGDGSTPCSPLDPDVYVGVRVGCPQAAIPDSTVYATGCKTFEIGRDGGEWVMAVHGRERDERVARFDADFASGEVVLSPSEAARCLAAGGSPLDHPLDELIVVHRLMRVGALVLRGTALVREGRALAFVGSGCELAASNEARSTVGWRRLDPLRAAGDRLAVRFDGGVPQVQTLPWSLAGAPVASLRAELDAIHLIESSEAVFSEPLDGDEATAAILENAFAPVHDPEGAARSGAVAEKLARRVPVLRLGMPHERRIIPFTWGQSEAALAFAPPV